MSFPPLWGYFGFFLKHGSFQNQNTAKDPAGKAFCHRNVASCVCGGYDIKITQPPCCPVSQKRKLRNAISQTLFALIFLVMDRLLRLALEATSRKTDRGLTRMLLYEQDCITVQYVDCGTFLLDILGKIV